jgi:hypothetical protein
MSPSLPSFPGFLPWRSFVTSMSKQEKRQRFLIGGAGGLAPILMFVVNGSVLHNFNGNFVFIAVGFLCRALGLFLLGGFAVTLYPEVKERYKVFQLGVSAPAMIAGLMTASANSPLLPPDSNASALALFPTVVYAQSMSPAQDVRQFTLPAPGVVSQFVQGVTGLQPANVYFVIVESFSTLDEARAAAAKINAAFPGFHADVYAPYINAANGETVIPGYSVVLGAQMTQQDASALKTKAANAGIGKLIYYRTFPNLPLPSAK